ncbi:transcriptional regulator [Salmonella enterica subsp. enterica serovar Daytona]|uniref:Transcriptional regulator n=1 Tax=Salmonella enterica subsp. enterica serovar Daytona TaxID=1962639 RepID=A0A447JA02_SALET|nr:transcriptional regulator [Salmonella enterica subsp. enterica serovar Daytona]
MILPLPGFATPHRVFIALNEKPNATAILCGGTYRAKSDAFYDANNPSALDSLNPRKVFISASGVHEHFGVSWFNPDDLAAKRKAMERGLRKFCWRVTPCLMRSRLPALVRFLPLMS